MTFAVAIHHLQDRGCAPFGRITVCGVRIEFSYDTPIAVAGYLDGKYVSKHIANSWGPTTGRHFNQLGVDRDNKENEVSEAELHTLIESLLAQSALDRIKEKLHVPPLQVST